MELDFAGQTLAIQNQTSKIQNPPLSFLVGVLMTAIYLALVPYVARTWRTTGDEPHYLLAAHSLVTDLDFDLTNNYDRLDYLAFYFSKDIDRHIRVNRAGQQILDHQLGLPILIAPAYALAGRLGVLAFQAILGGLLAAITFRLAILISQDKKAALLATFFVVLSPPLFMYQFLIYPELFGALLTTLVLYYVLRPQGKPANGAASLVILSLVILPWLNRRFVPLAFLLALFVIWAWRRPTSRRSGVLGRLNSAGLSRHALLRLPSRAGLVGLIATVVSVGLLIWFSSQLDEPLRADIIAPADTSVVWHRLVRGVGWLFDQQRGLFIFAPIYIFGLWGLPALISNSLKQPNRNWFLICPFLLSLGIPAAAGGYWVAWELGPRFLVVALPSLAPVLALAWRSYGRHKIWASLALLLFAVSVGNSLVIILNPELPYKSSLPVFYGQKFSIPFTELLPDLAGYARISATEADPTVNQIVTEDGVATWFAEAGRSLNVAQSGPLYRLPFGHYQLTWPVRVDAGLAPETELMRISASFLGGKPLFHKVFTAADLPPDGSYGMIKHAFVNTNIDRWRTPLVIHVVSTGRSNIWGRDMILAPDPFYATVLPYLYLTISVAGALLAWHFFRRTDPVQTGSDRMPSFTLSRELMWGVLLILPLVAFGNLIYQENKSSHTYDSRQLFHLVGRPIADPDARNGEAWSVDPSTDPPQKATHGPFDIYDPGRYRVTFRLKMPGFLETHQEVARLQINATANLDELVTQPIRPENFSRSHLYHDFVLTFNNPRRQALSFEVDYLGVAPLVIDEVTITKFEGG